MTQAKSTETIIQEIRRKFGLEFPQPLYVRDAHPAAFAPPREERRAAGTAAIAPLDLTNKPIAELMSVEVDQWTPHRRSLCPKPLDVLVGAKVSPYRRLPEHPSICLPG